MSASSAAAEAASASPDSIDESVGELAGVECTAPAPGPSHLAHPQPHPHAHAHLHLAQQPPGQGLGPGPSVFPPNVLASGTLNPRSCTTCRRRKVRCDKRMPCGNCKRVHIACVFPAPGRAPRRPRGGSARGGKHEAGEREQELLGRLRKLESIVEDLSSQIELEASKQAAESPEPSAEEAGGSPHMMHQGGQGAKSRTSSTPSDVSRQLGRLMLNERGGVRYVSSGFWSKVNDELEDLRREAEDMRRESEESDFESPAGPAVEGSGVSAGHQAFLFGYSSADVDMHLLHPPSAHVPFLWQTFRANIDPIVKMLHASTTAALMRQAATDVDSLTPSAEALVFAIYFSAVASLDPDDVQLNLGREKDHLLSQFRFAVEQALARAQFVTAPDVPLCQAFVLFLMLIRRSEDPGFSWALTGLLVRMSQALGLHRDGSNFPNLSPYDVEMRRRLFWAVLVVDMRSAEDQGTDAMMKEPFWETRMPLNINDADFSQDSPALPPPRDGFSDCSFVLVRYEILALWRRMCLASGPWGTSQADGGPSMQQRERALMDEYALLRARYALDEADESPMHNLTKCAAHVLVCKLTLNIYQPVLIMGSVGDGAMSSDERDRLLAASTEIFEFQLLVETAPQYKPWRWVAQTHVQWVAVAYVLLEVARRPWSPSCERSWVALSSIISHLRDAAALHRMTRNESVWGPFRKLYTRASKHRDAEMARLRADPAAAHALYVKEEASWTDPEGSNKRPRASVRTQIAHERWRKLVAAPAPQPQPQPPPPPTTTTTTTAGQSYTPPRQQKARLASGVQQPAAAAAAVADDSVMAMIGESFSSSQVHMPDIFSLAWTPGGGDGSGGGGGGGGPAVPGTNPNAMLANAAPRAGTTAGLPVPVYDDRSWMWAPTALDPSGSGAASSTATYSLASEQHMTDEACMATMGRPAFPEMLTYDGDMNLGDGFDWQHWQENLGRLGRGVPGPGEPMWRQGA